MKLYLIYIFKSISTKTNSNMILMSENILPKIYRNCIKRIFKEYEKKVTS